MKKKSYDSYDCTFDLPHIKAENKIMPHKLS